jgi:hypothetical protein
LASLIAPIGSQITAPSRTRSQPSDFILATCALKSDAPRLKLVTEAGFNFITSSCWVKPSSTFLPYSSSWYMMQGFVKFFSSFIYFSAARVLSTQDDSVDRLAAS